MDKRKEYLIYLFLKKANIYRIIAKSIEFSFKLLKNTYHFVTDAEAEELKEKFSIKKYIEKITPVVDKQFTIDELNEIISFYSSEIGRKLFDTKFLYKVDRIGDDLFAEIEQDFAVKNAKNQE